MEREILSRGKRLDNGKWVYGWYCKYPFGAWPLKVCIIPAEQAEKGCFEHVEVDPSTVGQYTGLTDKNGVKIFEGDILKHGRTLHEAVFENRNGHAYFGWRVTADETWDFDSSFLRQLEVIGNIHDNPELLEVTP